MSKLEVHVGGGFDVVAKRVTDVWHRAARGESVEPEEHLTFESRNAMTLVMSRRWKNWA